MVNVFTGGGQFAVVRSQLLRHHKTITSTVCRWLVLDVETQEVITAHTDGPEHLSVMRYSPGMVGFFFIPTCIVNVKLEYNLP